MDIIPFLPKDYDMSTFVGWAPQTSRLGALVLGVMVFFGILTLFLAGLIYALGVLTSNSSRIKTAKQTAQGGLTLILGGVLFGTIVTIIVTFVSYVKGG